MKKVRSKPGAVGEAARRSSSRSSSRWSDLRLWAGVAVLIASMFIGAQVVSGDEAGNMVWRAARDMSVGSTPSHVEAVRVSDPQLAQNYISADQPITGTLRWPISAGELVPLSALAPAAVRDVRSITIPVDEVHMPVALAAGDRVDLWVTSEGGIASLISPAVLVQEVSRESVGMGGHVAVVLEVPTNEVSPIVVAINTGDIDLVSVPVSSQDLP